MERNEARLKSESWVFSFPRSSWEDVHLLGKVEKKGKIRKENKLSCCFVQGQRKITRLPTLNRLTRRSLFHLFFFLSLSLSLSQVFSFETPLSIPCLSTLPSSSNASNPPFNGVFIRAPIVEELLDDSSSSKLPDLPSIVKSNHEQINGNENDQDGKVIEFNSEIEKDSKLPNNLSSSGPGSGKDGDVLRMSFAPSLFPSTISRPEIQILAHLEEIPQGASPIPSPKSIQKTSNGNTTNGIDNVTQEKNLKIPNRPRSDRQIVALRQGKIMMTSFHPELTQDNRLHEYWVREMVLK